MDVYESRFDYSKQKAFNFAFFSDLHLESKTHNRTQLDKDIKEAIEAGCRIYIGGDICEAIMPGDLKRYTRGRDSIDADAQLNEITRICFEWMRPYANFIDWIGIGNHEEAALKHSHYDITLGVITLLNMERDKNLQPIHHGGYKSFIRWRFEHGENSRTRTVTALHFHGTGGGAPVTKGMIDINRLRCDYEADIFWIGHKHTEITDKPQRICLDTSGRIIAREQRAFFTAGYQDCYEQDDYSDGYKISFADRMLSATSIGFAMLEVRLTEPISYRLTA